MKNAIWSAFIALIVSLAVVHFYSPGQKSEAPAESGSQTAFDRVIKNHELRCGYLLYPPNMMMDPNTKELSGVFYDAMEAIGKELNIKITWQEEGSYDVLIQSLHNGRIDSICSGLWENPAKSFLVDFSDYFYFNELAVYVRADDSRFDYNLDKLNNPYVSLAVVEGGIADQIAKSEYSNMKRHALPPLSDFPQLLMEVSSKKADATISATQEILIYDKNNQNKLRKVKTEKPFRVYPNVIFVKQGETGLLNVLNAGLHQIKHTGVLDTIISKYEEKPGTLLRTHDEFIR